MRRVPVAFGPAVGPGVCTITPPGGAAADHGSLGSSGSEPICPSGAPAGTKLGSAAEPRTGPIFMPATWTPVLAVLTIRTIAAARTAPTIAALLRRLRLPASRLAFSGRAEHVDPPAP